MARTLFTVLCCHLDHCRAARCLCVESVERRRRADERLMVAAFSKLRKHLTSMGDVPFWGCILFFVHVIAASVFLSSETKLCLKAKNIK